ncbi:MAG TPA: hypothetical protein VNH18_11075 [Bryobacteraceae bacterium]|nr:hypothetical protein [Bryobacteraceae bacterium]
MTDDRSEAARQLGSIRTPRKAASSRANAAKATAARAVKPCTCGRTDGSHRFDCPAYRRAAVARYREKKARTTQE